MAFSSGTSVPLFLHWTKGDPELSSSMVTTVVGAFTNRFLFLSPLVSGPSAGTTEMGKAGMGSVVASAQRTTRQLVGFWRARSVVAGVPSWKSYMHQVSLTRG